MSLCASTSKRQKTSARIRMGQSRRLALTLHKVLLSVLLMLTFHQASACSVHDHMCQFQGIGRAVNQTINQNSGTAVVIGTVGSNAVDFDTHVLLEDGHGPYIVSSNGITPRPDQPYLGASEHPRHIYPGQFQIDFQNGTAQATYSGDVTGGAIIPGAQGCTISNRTFCEEVRIVGNIPDADGPQGFILKQTNHLYNFPNVPNPQIDLISYGAATGRAYFKQESHLGQSVSVVIGGETVHFSGLRHESLSGTGDLGAEQTYYVGYNDFDPHAAGVVVHNNQRRLLRTDVYGVQFGHQVNTDNGKLYQYHGQRRANTFETYTRVFDFTRAASVHGLPELTLADHRTGTFTTHSPTFNIRENTEYADQLAILEAQRTQRVSLAFGEEITKPTLSFSPQFEQTQIVSHGTINQSTALSSAPKIGFVERLQANADNAADELGGAAMFTCMYGNSKLNRAGGCAGAFGVAVADSFATAADFLILDAISAGERCERNPNLADCGATALEFVPFKVGKAAKYGEDVLATGSRAADELYDTITQVDPQTLRYSQKTAGGNGRATELRESIGLRGWDGDPIDVVSNPDGSLTTIDNTRVAVANEFGLESIPARIRSFSDALPQEMIDNRRFGNATTWEGALLYRTQRNKLPPTGTNETPRLPEN